ncbi:MAG: class II glutamine amidotransferase [Candidatus Eisenbacteria sp.]|nr:class II glutamine amidotransferase [Candidatus Eisenbacteria bacterium]
MHRLGLALTGVLLAAAAGAVLLGTIRPESPTRVPEPHACRFWGLIGSDYPESLITQHLRDGQIENLKDLGHHNSNGWGLACFLADASLLSFNRPLTRRGRPPASHLHDPDYDLAIEELIVLRPRAAVGNVRLVAVRHGGLPNPHPFQHEGMVFVHSGHITNTRRLQDEFLTAEYIETHPLDYTGSYIDAELYFLYILKSIHAHLARTSHLTKPGHADARPQQRVGEKSRSSSYYEALCQAVCDLSAMTGDERIDFVLTAGDTLYALRFAGSDETDPLCFYPSDASQTGGYSASPYWVVATQPLGSDTAQWDTIPPRTLGVFVPGQAPQFHLIEAGDPWSPGPLAACHQIIAGGLWSSSPPAACHQSGGDGPASGAGATLPLKVRFWALVGSSYPAQLLTDQLQDGTLQNLKALGTMDSEGWGFASYPCESTVNCLNMPLCRRGGPPADDEHDPDYDLAVDEMSLLRPKAAVGHVRRASCGAFAIPNPHPFQHEDMLFGHNGTVDVPTLMQLLLEGDPDYLDTHLPEYAPHSVHPSGHIDSELYFLYLLKFAHQHPALTRAEAMRQAVANLNAALPREVRLNFVMTDGDTLYALRFHDSEGVRYFPGDYDPHGSPQVLSYWTVASEPLGSDGVWGTIAEKTLGVFVPGQVPSFLSIQGDTTAEFAFASIEVEGTRDQDEDGWFSRLLVCCDPDVEWGTYCVSLRLLFFSEGLECLSLGPTPCREITGTAPDMHCVDVVNIPDSLTTTRWDLQVELYREGHAEPVAVVTQADHPEWGLGGIGVEGLDHDELVDPDPPDSLVAWVGTARPNPGCGEVILPVHVPVGGATLWLEVWDSLGRRIWKGTPVWHAAGETELNWDGRDREGVRLPAGSYFLETHVGEHVREQRYVIVR